MSLIDQAMDLIKGRSRKDTKPGGATAHTELHLANATAMIEVVPPGGYDRNHVRIEGMDESRLPCSLTIEFGEPHRGKAAVFVDEVRRTGSAVLLGSRPSLVEGFRVDAALSGEARLGPEHRAFSPLKSISVGIASLGRRTPEAVELDAVAAHRSDRQGAGR